MTQTIPRGVWLGASVRLGRPVSTIDPYPHVCGTDANPQAWRRDCPACAEGRPLEAAERPAPNLRRGEGEVPIANFAPGSTGPQRAPLDPPCPPGRYAFLRGDKRFFYVVEQGWALGRLTVREQITDNVVQARHPKGEILSRIMPDVERAGLNYAEWLGRCRRCGRALTDNGNPYLSRGFGPDCGHELFG